MTVNAMDLDEESFRRLVLDKLVDAGVLHAVDEDPIAYHAYSTRGDFPMEDSSSTKDENADHNEPWKRAAEFGARVNTEDPESK